MRSDSSARAVSMMIGMTAVLSLARRSRHTSRPSTCGSIRSSTMRSGGFVRTLSSASRPDDTLVGRIAGLFKVADDEFGDVGVVLDHEHAGGHRAHSIMRRMRGRSGRWSAVLVVLLLSSAVRAQDGNPLVPAPVRPKHLTVAAHVGAVVVSPGATVSLLADITPNPGIHVYAPGSKGMSRSRSRLPRRRTSPRARSSTRSPRRCSLRRSAKRSLCTRSRSG